MKQTAKPRLLSSWDEEKTLQLLQIRTNNIECSMEFLVPSDTQLLKDQPLLSIKWNQDQTISKSPITGLLKYQCPLLSFQNGIHEVGIIIVNQSQSISDDTQILLRDLEIYQPIQITKWKIKVGDNLTLGQVLCNFSTNISSDNKLMSKHTGIVKFINPSSKIEQNEIILSISTKVCKHIKIEMNRCIECNAVIQQTTQNRDDNCFPQWQLPQESVKQYAMDLVKITIKKRKLFFILDLDLTILHAIRVKRAFDSMEFVNQENELLQNGDFAEKRIQVFELSYDSNEKYLIKLRPFWFEFIRDIYEKYEIYVYTKASRSYAMFILNQMNKQFPNDIQKPFSNERILTRDETNNHDMKNIERILPNDIIHPMVLILDDNQTMWNLYLSNLILTKPFIYFEEINFGQIVSSVKCINKYDCYLISCKKIMLEIYNLFFQQLEFVEADDLYKTILEKQIDVKQIYSDLKTQVLKGYKILIAISQAFEKDVIASLEKAKLIAIELGATIITEIIQKEENLFVMTTEIRNIKSIQSAKSQDIPIIHIQFLHDVLMYLVIPPWKEYDLRVKNGGEVKCEDIEKIMLGMLR